MTCGHMAVYILCINQRQMFLLWLFGNEILFFRCSLVYDTASGGQLAE
jgi:hypothetical protein